MSRAPAFKLKLSYSELNRFMAHVRIGEARGGCWLWTAARNRQGYGTFCVGGENRRAHRVSYAHFNGAIPEGQIVCHKCDNPSCVRPTHLFLGSARENTADSIAKGRFIKVTPAPRRTHCWRGHELTDENRVIDRRGHSRGCRLCVRDREAQRTRRRRRTAMADEIQP